MIIISSDALEKSANATIKICQDFHNMYSTNNVIRHDLLIMAKYFEKIAPTVTVAGFCPLNRATAIRIFYSVTTYMILISQVNEKVSQNYHLN